MQKLSTAVKYLTIWNNFTAVQATPATLGASMIYFPVIGLALGLFLALINYLLAPYLAPEVLSMILITALVVLTGANHLTALKNSFAAGAVGTSAKKDDCGETLGFIAIVLVLLFKAAAVDSMDEKLSFSLLLTPVLARWGVLIFVYGYQDRCDEILRPSAEQVKFWHLMLTTLGTLALGFYGLGKRGFWIALALSILVLSARSLLCRLRANLTSHDLGTIIELGETLSLILLASL